MQIARALAHCHKKNIAHRDLKTSNVLLFGHGVDGVGTAKLGDFGAAFDGARLSAARTQIGTPVNIAPEVQNANASGEYNAKLADIWGFGTIIYERKHCYVFLFCVSYFFILY